MSAESYAQQQFDEAKRNPDFTTRIHRLGATVREVVVVADSTPVGEVLARITFGSIVAVLDEDAPHGFALARIGEVER